MSSLEGYTRLLNDPDSLKKILDTVSYIEGLFKVKLNPYNDNIYYNILEMYKHDSSAFLNKAYKELKVTMKKFVDKMGWKIRRDGV